MAKVFALRSTTHQPDGRGSLPQAVAACREADGPATFRARPPEKRIYKRVLYASGAGELLDAFRMALIIALVHETPGVKGTLVLDGHEVRISLEGPIAAVDELCRRIRGEEPPDEGEPTFAGRVMRPQSEQQTGVAVADPRQRRHEELERFLRDLRREVYGR